MTIPSGLNASATLWARNVNDTIERLLNEIASLNERLGEIPAPVQNISIGSTSNVVEYNLAADVTFSAGDMELTHIINCTSACAITLPTALEGRAVTIENRGTAILTIKNPVPTIIGTVAQYQWTTVRVVRDSGGIASWPTGLVVHGAQGSIYLTGEIISRDTTKGVYLKSPGGNFWRMTIANTGALVTTDTGTTESAPTEPPL